MNDTLICTVQSTDEAQHALAALAQAGIPSGHVMVHEPEPGTREYRPYEESPLQPLRPIIDAIACGLVGGGFGAYVGVILMVFPVLLPLNDVGPYTALLWTSAGGAVIGGVLSQAIRIANPDPQPRWPDDYLVPAHRSIIVTVDDPQEFNRAHDILEAIGPTDAVMAARRAS